MANEDQPPNFDPTKTWFYDWITKNTDSEQIAVRGLLYLLQHELKNDSTLNFRWFELSNRVQNKLGQLVSMFSKMQTLMNTDFSVTYSRIIFNGIKVHVSGKTPASLDDDLIEYCVTELAHVILMQICRFL